MGARGKSLSASRGAGPYLRPGRTRAASQDGAWQALPSRAGLASSIRIRRTRPWALWKIDLRLEPGEVVAIVGPSGAGKTTLVSLLPRFWDVTEGRILIDGADVRRLSLADLRGMIGVVPPGTCLVRRNRPGKHRAYARRQGPRGAISDGGPGRTRCEFVERLPARCEQRSSVNGESSSRAGSGSAIARGAILKDPAILILDEATEQSRYNESERLVEDVRWSAFWWGAPP